MKNRLTKRKHANKSRVSTITDFTKEAVLKGVYMVDFLDDTVLDSTICGENDFRSSKSQKYSEEQQELTVPKRSGSLDLGKPENARRKYGQSKDNLVFGKKRQS